VGQIEVTGDRVHCEHSNESLSPINLISLINIMFRRNSLHHGTVTHLYSVTDRVKATAYSIS
jgi:hypothetical protein